MIMAILGILVGMFTLACIVGIVKEICDPCYIQTFIGWIMAIGFSCILTCFIAFVGFMLWAGTYAIFEHSFRSSKIERCTQNIVSIGYRDQTEGSFVIGCGTIKDVEYYVFYGAKGTNQYQRYQIPVAESVIEESSVNSSDVTDSPHLTWDRYHYSLPSWVGKTLWSEPEDKAFVCHVPQGTIVKRFTL